MGIAESPKKAMLFAAILCAPSINIASIIDRLKKKFGPEEVSYGPIPFSFSEYYNDEMGSNLQKHYLTFERLIERDELADIKTWTNATEGESRCNGKRLVNIDPGYLTNDKLVLASTKDFFHRIYLGKGIFGEVTLHFRKGKYRYFSWTYPDYREAGLQHFLQKGRARLVHTLRLESDDGQPGTA